jgi:hypothetical protein
MRFCLDLEFINGAAGWIGEYIGMAYDWIGSVSDNVSEYFVTVLESYEDLL